MTATKSCPYCEKEIKEGAIKCIFCKRRIYRDAVSNETKLTGRVYPAILSCMNNRYKIISGILIYYAFLISNPNTSAALLEDRFIGAIIPLFLFLFSLHNYTNYRANAIEQYKFEKEEWKYSELSPRQKFDILDMEIYTLILTITLLYSGYLYITGLICNWLCWVPYLVLVLLAIVCIYIKCKKYKSMVNKMAVGTFKKAERKSKGEQGEQPQLSNKE